MADTPADNAGIKDEVEPPPENVKSARPSTPEVAVKDAGAPSVPPSEASPKPAAACDEHSESKIDSPKRTMQAKKKSGAADSASESGSTSESSSSESELKQIGSEAIIASESGPERRKCHQLQSKGQGKRSPKDKKKKKKKKPPQRLFKQEKTDSDTDTISESDMKSEPSQDSDSSLDEKVLRKLLTKLKTQKRAKKSCDQTNDDQSSRTKKKPGSKVAFKRVDQLWDTSIHKYKLTETVDDPDAEEWEQYIFTVRRRFDWESKYVDTAVDIKSKYLRESLGKIMKGVKGVSLVEDPPSVDPNMLFLYLEETRKYMQDLKRQSRSEKTQKARKIAATKVAHLKVLIKFLDTDYADIKKTLYPLLESNTITFDLLWALYKPDTIAYMTTYDSSDEPRAFKIEQAVKNYSVLKGHWYNVEGRYLEYNGKEFGFGNISTEVEFFQGARKITSLSCYPIQYHREPEALRNLLVERGKRFVTLRGMNFRFHKGIAFYKKKRSAVIKVNTNGRVMIDPAIHRNFNPNYPISTVRPDDPDMMDASELGTSDSEDDAKEGRFWVGFPSDSDNGASSGARRTLYKVIEGADGISRVVEVKAVEKSQEIQKEKMDSMDDSAAGSRKGTQEELHERLFTEEELLVASPVVLGFAFAEKLWLEFTVSGISDIKWDSDAFDSLVLPDNQKSIVKALVESHTFHAAENIDDVIQGKGKGLVAVLHGPPGTGKTLTAESIAELLRRPLYIVSAGELGTDSRMLETELSKILEVAHSWGAVLLLDEADIFLEQRSVHDIHRNAMVSVFLRLLEYFQGILFLTTNRVETFDPAFQSRIHVALRYGELTTGAKRSIWMMFLDRVRAIEGVKVAPFTEGDYDRLARRAMNGRQIKNSVRTAQALAVNENVPLSMDHIKRVLEVAETFEQDLRGGSGYLDAMRSYT